MVDSPVCPLIPTTADPWDSNLRFEVAKDSLWCFPYQTRLMCSLQCGMVHILLKYKFSPHILLPSSLRMVNMSLTYDCASKWPSFRVSTPLAAICIPTIKSSASMLNCWYYTFWMKPLPFLLLTHTLLQGVISKVDMSDHKMVPLGRSAFQSFSHEPRLFFLWVSVRRGFFGDTF